MVHGAQVMRGQCFGAKNIQKYIKSKPRINIANAALAARNENTLRNVDTTYALISCNFELLTVLTVCRTVHTRRGNLAE